MMTIHGNVSFEALVSTGFSSEPILFRIDVFLLLYAAFRLSSIRFFRFYFSHTHRFEVGTSSYESGHLTLIV